MKPSGFIIGVLLIVGCSTSSAALAARGYDLKRCLEAGLRQNPGMAAWQERVASDKAGRKEAFGAFLPTLSAGYTRRELDNRSGSGETDTDYLSQTNTTYQVTLRQPIFNGLANIGRYQRAKSQYSESRERQKLAELQLQRDIAVAYFDLLKARADRHAAEAAVSRLQEERQAAQAFVEQQVKPKLHLLQVETELARARQKEVQARHKEQEMAASLASLLDLPPEQKVAFVGDLQSFPVEIALTASEVRQKALHDHPKMARGRQQVKMAQADVKQAISPLIPKVSLDLGFYRQDDEYDETPRRNNERDYVAATINVKADLFSGTRTWHAVSKQRHRVRSSEHQLANTKNQIIKEVQTRYLQVLSAKEGFKAARQTQKAAQEAYSRAKKRYETGIGTVTDVLDTQGRLTEAQEELNRLRADFQRAVSELDFAMGRAPHMVHKQ